jgi:hypothetical protein
MKSRVWFLLIFVYCFCAIAHAQGPAKRQQVLQVSTGGFISFKSETSAIDAKRFAESQSLASLLYSQALADENRIIHRVITDADRRIIFGYDLWVNSDPITRKFSLAVMPADEAFRRTFLKDPTKRPEDLFATFPDSTKPQMLDDGDAVSLELLVNQEAGIKIVDVVRVTFDSSRLLDRPLESAPRDFTLDAISMTVKNYELLIDGGRAGKGHAKFACTGALLWFYVPDRGRFIISLVPREGYAFQKIGLLDRNRIEFYVNNQHFEWLSSELVLPNGGTWNIWVLHDPNYTPLFGPEKVITSDKKPNVFERLNDAVKLGGGQATATWPKPPDKTFKPIDKVFKPSDKISKPLDIPQRVMVGGADSIDHLLPKSP